MILHVPAAAPMVVHAAAGALLFVHIGGAAVGLVAGFAAMAFRKGGSLHKAAGTAFFVGMLCMAGVGAVVAPFLPHDQVPNTIAGVFTFYMVATGWMTVRRRPGQLGRFETGAMIVAFAAAAGAVGLGWMLARSAHPLPQPQGTVLYVFAAIAALAGASDLSMIRRGGLAGAARLSRHLWRMSVGLLIAAGSFAGQPKAIPHFLRGSPLLVLPMLAVLALMIFWLVRVRRTGKSQPAPARVATAAANGHPSIASSAR